METPPPQPMTRALIKTPTRRRRLLRLVLAAMVLFWGMGAPLAWNTVRPKLHPLQETPAQVGMAFERVTFFSSDGTRLAGWYLPAKEKTPHGLIVLCHGVDSTRLAMLPKAQLLHRHGYATLLFDFRARGESGGSRCTIGYRETDDLLAAVAYARSRSDTRTLPIGVLGESMGGAVALMGTARSPTIRAVVAESPFAQLDHALANHFQWRSVGPACIYAAPTRWWGEQFIGRRCTEIAPVREVGRITPRPLLLIADAEDRLCPPSETRLLLAAAGEPKSLWTVAGANHIEALSVAPAEFERHVVAFFDAALPMIPAPPSPSATSLP